MRAYDPDLPVVMETAASRHAVGAVQEQEGFPVLSESRKLSEFESLAPAYSLEFLGIVHALNNGERC